MELFRNQRGARRTATAHYNEGLLTADQRERLDVVLVSPRNPLNIGAVARAMANFGLLRLTVVAPFAEHWREARSAVGAPELLLSARETATLSEAVAESTLVIGTGTLTYRRAEQEVVPLPALAPRVADALSQGGRVTVVFGPENHGLTREDLSYCHLLVEIPTEPQQPSMNLGQAAAVCFYELSSRVNTASPTPKSASAAVPSAVLDRLGELIDATMTAASYSPVSMQAANRHDLRLMLRRLRLTAHDTRRALGFFRRVLHRLRKQNS
jgi:TrmH family RNA methyltransferase